MQNCITIEHIGILDTIIHICTSNTRKRILRVLEPTYTLALPAKKVKNR